MSFKIFKTSLNIQNGGTHSTEINSIVNNFLDSPPILIKFVSSEDHWSCIAHLSAEDMLKSEVIEEKKLKNIESDFWMKYFDLWYS